MKLALGMSLPSSNKVRKSLLLDKYIGSAVAYSLRKLSSSTTNVIRVRESGGDTEQDFTADEITDGTLITFTGANDGFVVTWYDQSGNTRNMTQATAAKQGKIVASGVVLVEGGNPIIRAVSGSTEMGSTYDSSSLPTNKQFFSVITANNIGSGNVFFGANGQASDFSYISTSGNSSTSTSSNIVLSSELLNNQPFTYSTRGDLYTQLSSPSILSANSVFSYGTNLTLGYTPSSSFSMYDMQEIIIFDNQTDQSAKITAINSFYSKY
tara:strand:- start:287 stop:1087 length:801 start_codon:yes stop_codon:yes gene_type:complete